LIREKALALPEYSDGCAALGFNQTMKILARALLVTLWVAACVGAPVLAQAGMAQQKGGAPNVGDASERLFALANRERAQAGVAQLQWDSSLAAAALEHCRRMAMEGPISHQYNGEPDVAARVARAGGHFGVIEENVAAGPSADYLHYEWMHSPHHRENLLSKDVDLVGIAVVASGNTLYAVTDFARGVPVLTAEEVEARVADFIRPSGVTILDGAQARAACAANSGVPRATNGLQPLFVMRWQDSFLARLPQVLIDRLASGKYRQASVGSCPAQGGRGSFTAYRVAVLLY
jgi:uncharacterized protein YkwD